MSSEILFSNAVCDYRAGYRPRRARANEPWIYLVPHGNASAIAKVDKAAYVRQQQARVQAAQALLDADPDDEYLQDDVASAQNLLNLLVAWAATPDYVEQLKAQAAGLPEGSPQQMSLLGRARAISEYKLDGPPYQQCFHFAWTPLVILA